MNVADMVSMVSTIIYYNIAQLIIKL